MVINCDICGSKPLGNDDKYYNVRQTVDGKYNGKIYTDTIQCRKCIEDIDMDMIQSIVRIDNPMS